MIKNQIRQVLLLSTTVLVCACKVTGPDYVRPDAHAPAAFKEAAASKPIGQIDAQWWNLYGSTELDQLISQVALQNYSLQAVVARTQQARALTEVAQAAKLPTVMFQPLPGRRNDLGVMARWEIDLWGRIQRNIEASGASAQASVADLAAMKLSLQAQLAQNYFNLRVQDNQIRLLQETALVHERLLTVTQNQYAVGVADRSSVLHAETQLNVAQSQVHQAKVSRAQLEHAIAVLIGKAPADFSMASATMATSLPEVPLAVPAELLLRRPDIAAAERKLAAASAKIGEAEASAYPTLSLFAGVSIRSGLLGGPSVSMPIYSGGANEARKSEATSAYQEELANYQQTVLEAFREVEDNLASLQSLSGAEINQAQAVKTARASLAILTNQQQVGIINYPALISAQTAVLDTEKARLDTLAKRLVASVNLIKALGGGWQASELDALALPVAKK